MAEGDGDRGEPGAEGGDGDVYGATARGRAAEADGDGGRGRRTTATGDGVGSGARAMATTTGQPGAVDRARGVVGRGETGDGNLKIS